MELKQIVVNNGGMSQDLSVSKQENKLAFENQNIRIQATDDGTLLSVTNIKSPNKIKFDGETIQNSTITMKLYGSCVTPEYLILFGSNGETEDNHIDYIYRVTLSTLDNESGVDVKCLYNGNLNFSPSAYIDTLYYEEGEYVKKVYWTDGVNSPRVINIITPGERTEDVEHRTFAPYDSNVFEFYPNAFPYPTNNPQVPTINVEKNRTITSEIPAGVIQYFVSYYWLNGAETLIAAASDTYTVDFSNRGAKADEVGMCAFDIEIPAETVNRDFDYIRVYSAERTTYNGPLIVKIVGDIEINKDAGFTGNYVITDTGINQEQLSDGHLFFIGGSPFVAKTLTEKDNTLFLGGVKTKEVEISSTLKEKISNACRTKYKNGDEGGYDEETDTTKPPVEDPENANNVKWWVKNGIIDFKLNKEIPNSPTQFNSFYPYKLQLNGGSSTYKTFKSGEIYRFGIQFQTEQGEWSTVVWIGDKECTERPQYDEANQVFKVNNAEFNMPPEIIESVKAAGFVNYRIVIADPEKHNGRKIKMQGVVNPTLFTPGQRALDAPYALPSWIMRPRKGEAAYHHFEPLFSTEVSGSELASYTPKDKENITSEFLYPYSHAYVSGYDQGNEDATGQGYGPLPPSHDANPYPEDTLENKTKHNDWNSGYDQGYEDVINGSPQLVRWNYAVTAEIEKTKYTRPYIQYATHENLSEYIVTCFTVSPGNQLAVRSVRVWSNDATNNFYDVNGNQPSDYEVICDYAGSIGGAVYNNYGAILDYVEGTSPNGAYTFAPALVGGEGEAPHYGLTNAFTLANIDARLIPDPSTLASIAGSLVNSAVGSVFMAIFKAVVMAASAIIIVCLGILSAGTALIPGITAFSAIISSLLAIGIAIPAEIITGASTSYVNEKQKSLYSTDPIISREYLRYLMGSENYNKLYEWQRTLISQRYLPLYSTTGNGGNIYSRTIGGTPKTAGDTDWCDKFDEIVFSNTQDFYYIGTSANTGNKNLTLPSIFKPRAAKNTAASGDLWLETATYIQVFPISVSKNINEGITKEYNNYYIDESFLTLNSPEVESGDAVINDETLKFRTIGVIPLTSTYSNASIDVNKHFSIVERGLDYSTLYSSHRTTDGFLPLYSDYLYLDAGWDKENVHDYLNIAEPAAYKIHLFSQNNYLGIKDASELVKQGDPIPEVSELPGLLKKQQIINHIFSDHTRYFNLDNIVDYGDIYFGLTKEETPLSLNTDFDLISYYPTYSNAILEEDMSHHYILKGDGYRKDKQAPGSVSINFSSTPHVIIDLQNSENIAKRNILPFFKNESYDYYRDVRDTKNFVWNDLLPENILNISGRGVRLYPYDPDVPVYQDIPDSVKEEIIGMLAPKTYNDDKGIWMQNATSGKSSYSVWDKGATYHCNKYFIVDYFDNDYSEPDPFIYAFVDFITGDYRGGRTEEYCEQKVLSHIKNTIWAKCNDATFLGILIGELQNQFGNSEISPNNSYILNLENAEIPIIIGCWAGPSYEYYAGKFSILQLEIHAEKTEDGWVIDASNNPIENIVLDYNYAYEDGVLKEFIDKEIYLEGLNETQKRNIFSLDGYIIYESGHGGSGTFIIPYQEYNDFRIKYDAPEIREDAPLEPYLFMGELYQDIPHDVLYGGIADHNLRTLSWYPISKTMPIEPDSTIEQTEGDTYYQRWDCLKTYPKTEEDINQVVDITSFMVETHKNLDARCDVNRATYSLMSRPTNFNLYNLVYNQPNNIFEYSTDWSNLNSSNTPNMITWSLTKNLFGDVDTWTNITLENNTRTQYPVTKLLNWNNQVLALTEHSMEIVNFNAKNLVPSTDNSFIELQNSNKVDGTTKLQNPYGTHNMSTLITEQGLYFIDDNEKSLIRINGEGPKKIGITKLTDWFHNNVIRGTHVWNYTTPLHLEYDNVHKDIYIKGSEGICLVYNELLDEFTSIITYSGDYWLFNYSGNLYAYRTPHVEIAQDPYEYTGVELHKMFSGTNYNKDFGGVNSLDYSVSYVINPNSYTDKVFTNGILAADLGTVMHSLPNDAKNGQFPFNTVQVWNEYQNTGVVSLQKILDNPSNLKDKFRFWRFIIPRDANSTKWPKDRIRNPWARIKLVGNSNDKMEFHNMTIQYME